MGPGAAGERELNRLAAFGLMLAVCAAAMPGSAAADPQRRLPPGTHWGRCLLVVYGQTRISGKCSYRIERNSEFLITGPRQLFEFHTVGAVSEDYWARVFPERNAASNWTGKGGNWTGYGNDLISSVHGNGDWGILQRKGACFIGKKARVCLWRK